jgi:hypothetical protein
MPDLVSPHWAMAHSPIQMIYIQLLCIKFDVCTRIYQSFDGTFNCERRKAIIVR